MRVDSDERGGGGPHRGRSPICIALHSPYPKAICGAPTVVVFRSGCAMHVVRFSTSRKIRYWVSLLTQYRIEDVWILLWRPPPAESGGGEVDYGADGMDAVHGERARFAELAKAGFIGGKVDREYLVGTDEGLLPVDPASV